MKILEENKSEGYQIVRTSDGFTALKLIGKIKKIEEVEEIEEKEVKKPKKVKKIKNEVMRL